MKETKADISKTSWLLLTEYDNGQKYIDLEYIERSSDHWYSDSETSIQLDNKTCSKIIKTCMEFMNVDLDRLIEIANICRTQNTQLELSSMLRELDSSLEELNIEEVENENS